MLKFIGIRRLSEINRRYKKYNKLQIGGPLLLFCGHHLNNDIIENMGQIMCTMTGILNYGMFYVDNYIYQLELWREEEGEYEEKEEPPKWNLRIEKHKEHKMTVLELINVIISQINIWQIAIIMNVIILVLRKDMMSIIENCLSICEIFF